MGASAGIAFHDPFLVRMCANHENILADFLKSVSFIELLGAMVFFINAKINMVEMVFEPAYGDV